MESGQNKSEEKKEEKKKRSSPGLQAYKKTHMESVNNKLLKCH